MTILLVAEYLRDTNQYAVVNLKTGNRFKFPDEEAQLRYIEQFLAYDSSFDVPLSEWLSKPVDHTRMAHPFYDYTKGGWNV